MREEGSLLASYLPALYAHVPRAVGLLNRAGRHEVVDLVPNGRNVMVTDENKLEYVQRITHHRMTNSIRDQIEAFLEGEGYIRGVIIACFFITDSY